MRSGGRAIERGTVNWWLTISKYNIHILAVVKFHLPPFRNLGNFVQFCLCISEETPKADGPFYLVSMPGEVKDPTQGINV